jgi:hypothetical protein
MRLVGWIWNCLADFDFNLGRSVGAHQPVGWDEDGFLVTNGNRFEPDEFFHVLRHTGESLIWAPFRKEFEVHDDLDYYDNMTVNLLVRGTKQDVLHRQWQRFLFKKQTRPSSQIS